MNAKASMWQTKNENSSKNEEKTNEVKDANDINTKSNEEIEILREEKLRLLAEMENLRKRSQKDKIDSIKYGNLNFAKDILALGDNLARALDAISSGEKKSESFNQLIDGLKIVQKEL